MQGGILSPTVRALQNLFAPALAPTQYLLSEVAFPPPVAPAAYTAAERNTQDGVRRPPEGSET
ncbi:MAG: hypothetical protein AMS14_09980 [Planctomycetes bacterium DG_20]|nr:MAG: hypothetical protein AMS14_09980 [Planctomycetes bacterium DG_20]